MKTFLLSSVLALSLSGCLMPSGINPTLGCSPITGCQEKDYYLPGKGVWAPKESSSAMFNKAKLGALSGAAVGVYLGKDPTSAAIYGVLGLLVGYTIGDTMDKIDTLYASQMMQSSMNHNIDGQSSVYINLKNQVQVVSKPLSTDGDCREFVSVIEVQNTMRKMRGTSCKRNGKWEVKNLY